MTFNTILAVTTVVTGLGGVGIWHLITREANMFTKCALGWFFAAAWAFGAIMPTVDHGQITNAAALSLFFWAAVLPGFPVSFVITKLKYGRKWAEI